MYRFFWVARRTALPAALFLLILSSTTHPALATSVVTGGGSAFGSSAGDFLNIGQYINGISDLITGPIAKFVAIIAVIGGAFMFIQGREMNEGLRNLGVLAIGIGLVIAIPSIINLVRGAVV